MGIAAQALLCFCGSSLAFGALIGCAEHHPEHSATRPQRPELPRGVDKRLVGTWGTTDNTRGFSMLADGSGHLLFRTTMVPFEWGASGQTFVYRRRETDSWVRKEFRFALSKDGHTLTLKNLNHPKGRPWVLRRGLSPYDSRMIGQKRTTTATRPNT